MLVKHLRRFGGVWLGWFSFGWLCLESSGAFGLVTTANFGALGYAYLVLLSFVAATVTTYLSFGSWRRTAGVAGAGERQPVNLAPALIDFHESYRSTDWQKLLGSASDSVTLCGYYFDSWLGWTESQLKSFLRKDKARLRVIVSKPQDKQRLEQIARLFPQYGADLVSQKISGTKSRIEKMLAELGVSHAKLEFYEYPDLLNYSYILVDGRLLYVTVYEMERSEKRDSFAIILDLDKHPAVKAFIEKENRLILQRSVKAG